MVGIGTVWAVWARDVRALGGAGHCTVHRATPVSMDGTTTLRSAIRMRHPRRPSTLCRFGRPCKVQVKSSQKYGKVRLKLSTLREMTDPTIPGSGPALVSKDGVNVESVHLLHIHGDRLAEIRASQKTGLGALEFCKNTFEWEKSTSRLPPLRRHRGSVGRAIGDPKQYIDAKRGSSQPLARPIERSVTVKSMDEGGVYERCHCSRSDCETAWIVGDVGE